MNHIDTYLEEVEHNRPLEEVGHNRPLEVGGRLALVLHNS